MQDQTRRRFLKTMAALGGAGLLAPLDLLRAEEGNVTAEEAAIEAGDAGLSAKAAESPAMSIARWGEMPIPDEQIAAAAKRLTEQALQALGGIERFVSKGDVVWIKPNIGWNRAPELAAGTNPDVVATLTRLCLDAGVKKVKIGDNPCHEAKQCYRNSGIEEAARAAGAEMVYLDEKRFRTVKLGGERLDEWQLYPEVLEADLVINVPILKHHGLSRATACMKNYMGIIGGRRDTWHQALPECLIDITRFMKPRICVLDAVRILTNHGPQGGNPADVKLTGVVAAGTDIVALDALGAELLGHDPKEIQTVAKAQEAGLGEIDFRNKLAVEELTVS
jgi:uncharacterized protein (DUF362 family)